MDHKILEDLIDQLDNDDGSILGDRAIYTTQEDRDLLLDALLFYKEMQVI
jgi:hypothetical protein